MTFPVPPVGSEIVELSPHMLSAYAVFALLGFGVRLSKHHPLADITPVPPKS